MALSLTPFSQDSSPFSVTVDVRNRLDLAFVEFAIHGDASMLEVASQTSGRAHDLWRSTCVELFTKEAETAAYREYNFSLSGQWNCYDFSDYRKEQSEASLEEEPDTAIRLGEKCLRLSVVLPWQEIANKLCNVSAVLKLHDGSYSYWATEHTENKPDFHAPLAFTKRFDADMYEIPEKTGEERAQGILKAIEEHNQS